MSRFLFFTFLEVLCCCCHIWSSSYLLQSLLTRDTLFSISFTRDSEYFHHVAVVSYLPGPSDKKSVVFEAGLTVGQWWSDLSHSCLVLRSRLSCCPFLDIVYNCLHLPLLLGHVSGQRHKNFELLLPPPAYKSHVTIVQAAFPSSAKEMTLAVPYCQSNSPKLFPRVVIPHGFFHVT